MALTILSCRLIAPARPFLLGGVTETAATLQLSVQTIVSYPDGSEDTLPALTLALLPDGVTTTFDWTRDRYIGYTVKGSGVLSVVKEALLASLDGSIAPVCWVREDEVHPWQPTQVGTLTPSLPTIAGALCGSSEVPLEPTISWTGVPGGTNYELEVGTDPTFTTSFLDVTVAGLSYTLVSPLSADTVYYVRVRETAPVSSDWSPECSFTTGLFAGVPHITYPPDTGTQIYLAPLYTWTGVAGASTYEVEVATDSGFTSIVFDRTGLNQATGYQFPDFICLTMDKDYYVRARVASPSVGSWGPTNHFHTYALSGNAGDFGSDRGNTWVSISTDAPGQPAYGKAPFGATDWTVVLFIEPLTDIGSDGTRNAPVIWAMGPSGTIAADLFGNGTTVPANEGKLSGKVASAQANSAAHALAITTHYCVAMVVEGTIGNAITLYLNGVVVGTASFAGSVNCPRMGFGYAGFAGGGPGAFQSFRGKIRNVQWYRNKLNSADIAAIVADGRPIATASSVLDAVWPVDEGSGTLVHDLCTDQDTAGRDGIWADATPHWTAW